MSQAQGRRQRLAAARLLPPLRCPGCQTPLERVVSISAHLRRCDEALKAEEQRITEALGYAQ